MMYSLKTSNSFLHDLKTCKKRGYDMDRLWSVIGKLQNGEYECHIGPDWLLIWEQNDTELTLLMLSTGTHSDLF